MNCRTPFKYFGLGFCLVLVSGGDLSAARDVPYPVPPHPEVHLGAPRTLSKQDIRDGLVHLEAGQFRFDDKRYVRLEHDYLPKLLDWHHALRDQFAHIRKNSHVDARHYNERAAHVIRVLLGLNMRRDAGFGDAAVMIGSVRLKLPLDWLDEPAGTTLDFILVGTDRGYFLIDPVTRTGAEYSEELQRATSWLHL